MDFFKIIPDRLQDKFVFYNYNHAIEIISTAFPEEWKDIIDTLDEFKLYKADLAEAGGAETKIPGKIDAVLQPRKWKNIMVMGELSVRYYERVIDRKQYEDFPVKEHIVPDYLHGQQVDYLKGRVALYLEWNKKDLAFSKVLIDVRRLFECKMISAAVIITRDQSLNDAFKEIPDEAGKPIFRKYGSSSTWMGKLLPKLDSGEAGGCPVLAIGIKKSCIEEL